MDLVKRFLKYVSFDTQSDDNSTLTPSTNKQLVLGKYLVNELKSIGCEDVFLDQYGIVYATIPSNVNNQVPTIGLIAHMDTSPDCSGANVKAKIINKYDGNDIILNENTIMKTSDFPSLLKNKNEDLIVTDGTTLLGADDKAGVAVAILFAIELSKNTELKHGGLEIVFTRDEEQSMTGIHNVKMKELESEHVIVMDADALGQVQISGADYTKLSVNVTALKGGHSGIDIDDNTRVNAAKLIAELVNEIPQGVYHKDEFGVVTSINLGVIVGGGIHTAIDNIKEMKEIKSNQYQDYMIEKAVTNVINTKAGATYSIRSSSRKYEDELVNEIKVIVDNFNKKYNELAIAELETEEHLPPFEKSDDETLINVAKEASENLNIDIEISSFHAGAETHIYANEKNKHGVTFKPVLIGVADIYNMHSVNEQIDYVSYLKGYELIKEMFKVFNKN